MEYQSGRIKHLMFYPVKSISGIEVASAVLTDSGLAIGRYADHGFMVVRGQPNDAGLYRFVTQRDKRDRDDKLQGLSVMALIMPELAGDCMKLTWNYCDPIEIPPDRNSGRELPVKIWDHEAYAVDQGEEIAGWLSDHLKTPLRLVKAAGPFKRWTRQNYMANDNALLFQDGYPVHWFPMESVNELSGKAGQDIPWKSFRPQIVAEGMQPQYEHQILSGEMAGVPFIDPKPCDRCPVTLVDQGTGIVRGNEPLAALSKYKKWRNKDGELKVIFGENMLPAGEGQISIGDEINVKSHRDPPLVYGPDV